MISSAGKSFIDSKLKKYPEIQDEYDKTRFIEPLITSDLLKLNISNIDFVGLEYSVKSASSIEDKIPREIDELKENPALNIDDLNTKNIFSNFTDIIRYTQIVPHKDIFEKAKDTIDELEKKGYKLSKIKNYYLHPFKSTGYKGLHLNFISPQGKIFELQVHSKESYRIKQEAHKLYEKIRSIATDVAFKEKCKTEIIEKHSSVDNPPGYETLKDYRLENSEIKKYIEELNKPQVSVSTKTDENIKAIAYNICQNGELLLSGIENHHSDGSVYILQCNPKAKEAKCEQYTPDGELAASKNVTLFKEVDINRAFNIAQMVEQTSIEWMKENYPEEHMKTHENTSLIDFVNTFNLVNEEQNINEHIEFENVR